MYLILFLAWLLFNALSNLTAEDPKSATEKRLQNYENWLKVHKVKRYGYPQMMELKDRLFHDPDFQNVHYSREYLKNLLGHDVDYKKAHYDLNYCYEIIHEVAFKEGWIVPPEGKTWQQMEPRYWIALWGDSEYYKWMNKRGLTPNWKYPE